MSLEPVCGLRVGELQDDRDADRLTVVVYRLSKGDSSVPIPLHDAYAEVSRERIFLLSDAQFEEYRKRVLAEVKAHRIAKAGN